MLESLTINEQARLLVTVGKHGKSRPITPIQVMELLHKTIDVDQDIGATADCLELKDTSMLRKFMDLKNLPEHIWPLVSWGTTGGYLSFSTAALIAKVEDESDVNLLTNATIEYQLTKNEIRSVIQRIRRGKKQNISTAQAVEEIVNLRPVVVHQYLYYGNFSDRPLSTDDDKELQRAIRSGLAKLFNPDDILAVKVTNGKFAFTLNQNALDKNPQLSKSLSANQVEGFITSIAQRNLQN